MNDTLTPMQTVTEPLTLRDGCDACGHVTEGNGDIFSPSHVTRAYVRVTLTSGGVLDFCHHHYQQHETALLPLTASVEDTRELLSVKIESGFAG